MNQPDPTTDRRDRYAAAMAKRDGDTWPTEYENDEADYRRRADAAMAVADAEQAELRARVERLALTFEVSGNEFIAERIRAAVAGAEPPAVPSAPTSRAAEELASLAAKAGRALQDEKRHYEIACHENARLRAAVERVRAALETEAVVGRTALEYRGLILAALMAAVPAAEEQPENETPGTAAALLSSRCDACTHTLNWHRNDVGCTVPLCACGRFQPPAVVPQPEEATAEQAGWRGATELASDREIAARAATGLVGYRQNNGRLLHCLAHKPAPVSRHVDFHEVTADDLPDGGICVHPRCGRDLLALWPAMPTEEQPS